MQKRPGINSLQPGIELIHEPIGLNREFPVSFLEKKMHTPDAGPLILLHYHDSLEIGYCYKGSGIFMIDNKVMSFTEGCASIIFPKELHIAKSNPEDPSSWRFINLDPAALLSDIDSRSMSELLVCLDRAPEFHNIISGENNKELIAIVKEILDEAVKGDEFYKQAVKGLTLCLMVKLFRMFPKSPGYSPKAKHNSILRLTPALDYIYQNYNKHIIIQSLADSCGMSITNFRRNFIKAIGVSPLQYIHQVKIRMASSMLTGTNLSVLEISMLSGYESLSGFNRHFKRIMNSSPSQWRAGSAR